MHLHNEFVAKPADLHRGVDDAHRRVHAHSACRRPQAG
jgi:hypothetical protein